MSIKDKWLIKPHPKSPGMVVLTFEGRLVAGPVSERVAKLLVAVREWGFEAAKLPREKKSPKTLALLHQIAEVLRDDLMRWQ